MEFYTYVHLKASDGSVFYVGKGTKRRAKSKANRNQYWHNIANKHGFRHEILSRFANHEEAYEHEKFLIWCFRDMGLQLSNLSDGGSGKTGAGKPHTEEYKEKMSKLHSGDRNPMFGKKHSKDALLKIKAASTGVCRMSDETLKRMSLERTGVKRPASVGEKIRAAKLGKKLSEQTREKMKQAHAARRERIKNERQN